MTNVKCHQEGLQLYQTIPQTIANIACEIAEGRTMDFNITVSFESKYHLVAKRCYDSGYPACVARLPELDVHDHRKEELEIRLQATQVVFIVARCRKSLFIAELLTMLLS